MKKMCLVGAVLAASLVSGTSAAQSEGGEYYNDRYCMTCHGADGIGNQGVSAPRLAGMEAWYLKRQLESFRAGMRGIHLEDDQGREMQPMAAKLSDESIADIVAWVGTWEYKPREVTISGDAAAGKTLYTACASCHGAQGQGNEALGAPALAGQSDWYLATQLHNFKAGYRGNDPQDRFGSQMLAMASMLDEAAITNVVSYINTLGR